VIAGFEPSPPGARPAQVQDHAPSGRGGNSPPRGRSGGQRPSAQRRSKPQGSPIPEAGGNRRSRDADAATRWERDPASRMTQHPGYARRRAGRQYADRAVPSRLCSAARTLFSASSFRCSQTPTTRHFNIAQ
jgi:hypothetical protein